MELAKPAPEVRPRTAPAPEIAKLAAEVRPRTVPAAAGVKVAVEIRPRFVWGRRPRANGGRRRPRGRYGYFKYAPVVSRGSFPAPAKAPLQAPRLDQFPLVPINLSTPTGNPAADIELDEIALLCGAVARMRLLIRTRAEMMMSCGVHRADNEAYWRKHDNLLRVVEHLCDKVGAEYGVEAPAVPAHFYQKF